MELRVAERLGGREIIHYADAGVTITSHHRRIFLDRGAERREFRLPRPGWKHRLGFARLLRRVLRTDKCNVVPIGNPWEALLAIADGVGYRIELADGAVRPTLRLGQGRCVLHQSISVVDGREILLGEYGQNPERGPVSLHRSLDGGLTWDVPFVFPAGKIKHVHGCYWDPVEARYWIFTGDFAGENYVLVADRAFETIEWLGDGSQPWRAVSGFFEPDAVHWLMDSQLEDSHHIRLDRKTRTISRGFCFPGPVWYVKKTDDGYYLAATACERGPAVHTPYAHVFASRDLATWQEVARFRHDGWPKGPFKFGVIGFADGPATATSIYMFGEALRGLDGQVVRCELVN